MVIGFTVQVGVLQVLELYDRTVLFHERNSVPVHKQN